jgi:hypothetical protein
LQIAKRPSFVGLQVALFHYAWASVQLVEMSVLQQNSQINRFGTMPAKRKASGERFLEKVIRRSCRTSHSDALKVNQDREQNP